jgi:chromosome segregation protein|tara:strand:+ start:72054 stop:75782 length:3729 start_codon:yes stop_codon:yes gene_type:complete
MHLKELRINGFKSFADNTKLTLEPGVTAIVGPNGCGKSNIADAIRWVLGEQSAKSLRAGGMQDVIFQGSEARKPVNLCEVSLIFTECEEQLGTDFAEVEVTRRVLRDGGGQYFINGKQCRLKDIQRLFLDTGIGQVSYSFMLQGQIDQILSSNPAERRTIFEEAAGISRYKAQRREALNKLSSVDANLARVTDVIEEVSRQIGSLKRQASKALRYKRIKHRLTHLDLANSSFQYADLRRDLVEREAKSQFLRTEADKLKGKLEGEESGLGAKREKRTAFATALEEAQQAVFNLRNEQDSAKTKGEFAEIRRIDNEKRIGELADESEALSARQKELQDRAFGEAEFQKEQMSLFGSSDELFKSKSAELAELQSKLTEAETELSRDRQGALVKESSITRLRSNCTTLEVDLKSYQVRHANLADEIKGAENEGAVVRDEISKLEKAHISRKERKVEETTRETERREQVTSLVTAFRSKQEEIGEADRRLAAINAQIGVLEGLQAKLEGFSDGAKAILQGKVDGIDQSDCDVLLKSVKVAPEFSAGLESLLGALAEGVVVKNSQRVGPLAAALVEKRLGRAHLKFVAPTIANASTGFPEDAIRVLDVVSASDAAIQPVVVNLLQGCYFVTSLSDFLSWWEQNPSLDFSQVVTSDGEVVDRRGWVLTAPTKKAKDRSFLARANEIKAFSKERVELDERLEIHRHQGAQLSEKIERAEAEAEAQRARVVEIGQEVATLESQLSSARRNLEQVETTGGRKQRELANLEEQKSASERRLETGRSELAEAEADLEEQRKKVVVGEERANELRNDREQRRDSFNDIRVEMAEKKQRLASLEKGLSDIEAQTAEVVRRQQRLSDETKLLAEQNKLLSEEKVAQRNRFDKLDEEMTKVRAHLEQRRADLKAVELEIDAIEKGLSSQRESYDRISRELNVVDVAIAKEQSKVNFLEEETRREYDLSLDSVNWRDELWQAGEALPSRLRVDMDEDSLDDTTIEVERPDPTEEDLAALGKTDWSKIAAEVNALRSKLHAIGAVNLVAIEEYKELNDRHTFLKTQSDDLWAAKDELLKAIDEINTTSQVLFAETFKQIRENFIHTFDKLFGGGKADLELIDDGDVLESGIEIIARPPGTRLKTLQLLSGGQKTMTAVALLFAVYMVKPSPFCVLDELDAPLDDANIGRFCGMLEEFLSYSQFLIITHNKRTIGVADTIYGVTMQERGVSRLASMRFNRDTGDAEVAKEEEASADAVSS